MLYEYNRVERLTIVTKKQQLYPVATVSAPSGDGEWVIICMGDPSKQPRTMLRAVAARDHRIERLTRVESLLQTIESLEHAVITIGISVQLPSCLLWKQYPRSTVLKKEEEASMDGFPDQGGDW
jgi:hypothetical protein